MRYDAIIVGGSFAGLAVASQLRGNILLIDRKEVGAGQTSACGTLYSVPERLGCLDSILQVHNSICLHTASRTTEYQLLYPFCTFDYRKFCQIIQQKIKAKIVTATVKGVEGDAVLTERGRFHSDCIIDCSGWRAILASSLDPHFVDRRKMSFGFESLIDYQKEGLHFWTDPRILSKGVTWIFPVGQKSRVGIGSYVGKTDLKDNYLFFLKRLGLRSGSPHGGFFPWTLRKPAVGNIFLVGDAAGQCLPFTGEGIRPALYFGQHCGKIVQRVIDGEITLQEGLDQYRMSVDSYRPFFRILLLIQKTLITFPNSWITGIGILVSKKSVLSRVMRMYEASFILEEAQIPRQTSSISALKDTRRSSRREQVTPVATAYSVQHKMQVSPGDN